jgi:hypothetical protein
MTDGKTQNCPRFFTILTADEAVALGSLTLPLEEETILNLGEFHGQRAFLVIVRHVIDPTAHGIARHQPSIVGLQQFLSRF